MKIGCGTVLFRKFELERALCAIRDIGFTCFETQAVGPWCPHVDIDRDDPENLVRLKKKYGFEEITGLWMRDGSLISNEKSVASGIRSIEWAAAAGIPVVHTGDGHKPSAMSEADAHRFLEERLAALLETAQRYRVKIAIEPHGTFSLTAKGLAGLMKLGSPETLGINYDAANIHRAAFVESGNNTSRWQKNECAEDELEVLKAVAGRVIHCHAKDIDDATRQCVAIGDGNVRVAECVKYLKSTGYGGVISLETEGADDFDGIVALAAKSYKRLTAMISE